MATNGPLIENQRHLLLLRLGDILLLLTGFAGAVIFFHLANATPEFRRQGWGIVLGVPFGVAFGLSLFGLQRLSVGISDKFNCCTKLQVWLAPALSVLAGVGGWIAVAHSFAPSTRLARLLAPADTSAATHIRMAGFNSFLSVRWYASFNLPSNQVLSVARLKGLTNRADLGLLDDLRQRSHWGRQATESGVVPLWSAAVIWHRDGKPSLEAPSSSWDWLAVDATGTNCFFARGYQN